MPYNEQRSALEVFDWHNDPPDRYSGYVREDDNGNPMTLITWMGDRLGEIIPGRSYKCPSFGRPSTRQAIRVNGDNGVRYYGTYYKSSGDYCRIRRIKGGHNAI